MWNWLRKLFGRAQPTQEVEPPRPSTFQSCERCGAVSITNGTLCPECYLQYHQYRPTPDMFTEEDVQDAIEDYWTRSQTEKNPFASSR